MKKCYQFKSMNMLDHGHSVWEYFQDLYRSQILWEQDPKFDWRIPDWITKIKHEDLDLETIRMYLIYHDCGKPFCRTVDQDGRQHFPAHAEVSYRRWLQFSTDTTVANLIRSDMDIHTLKADDIEEFKKRPEAITLLMAALCEIHSNSQMFGGIESTSFKIKWKHLNKIGRRLLE